MIKRLTVLAQDLSILKMYDIHAIQEVCRTFPMSEVMSCKAIEVTCTE